MQRFCSNSSLTSCGLHVDLRGLRLETQATVRRHIREGKKPHTHTWVWARMHTCYQSCTLYPGLHPFSIWDATKSFSCLRWAENDLRDSVHNSFLCANRPILFFVQTGSWCVNIFTSDVLHILRVQNRLSKWRNIRILVLMQRSNITHLHLHIYQRGNLWLFIYFILNWTKQKTTPKFWE